MGTKVTVTYARPGVTAPIIIAFTRREVHIPAVAYMTVLDSTVGYIPLQTFNENVVEEVTDAVTKLTAQGAKGLVLTGFARQWWWHCGSGAPAEQSLPEGILQMIASVRSRGQPDEVTRAGHQHLALGIPLIVMTDDRTASASEIVAGALQDPAIAQLVLGTTSFGKGLVQSLYNLDAGYSLKLTTGKWYTPSGRSIHRDRKLTSDGQLIETRPDSLETDSERLARPKFKIRSRGAWSMAGVASRLDVNVAEDTLSKMEQDFLRSVAAKIGPIRTVLEDYSRQLRDSLRTPTLELKPVWKAELMRRVKEQGVSIEPRFAQEGDRVLSTQLARLSVSKKFGDGATRQLTLSEDTPLVRAVALLKKSQTQGQLLAAGAATPRR